MVNSGTRSGTYAARVGPSPAALEQYVPVAPRTRYRASGWVKSAVADEVMNGTAVTSASTTSSTYSEESTTFTTGAGVTSARIYCHLVSGSGDGYCDEVTLTQQ